MSKKLLAEQATGFGKAVDRAVWKTLNKEYERHEGIDKFVDWIISNAKRIKKDKQYFDDFVKNLNSDLKDIIKKTPIDEKSHFSHAVETTEKEDLTLNIRNSIEDLLKMKFEKSSGETQRVALDALMIYIGDRLLRITQPRETPFDLSKSYKVKSGFYKGDILRPVSIARNGDIMCLNSSRWAPTDKPSAWRRDEMEVFKRPVEPKKKITLNLKGGGSITFNPNMKNADDVWKACESVLIEQWLTKEELIKLYPQAKIHE